jgi:uncharacterized protein (DUF697 family)
VAQLKLGAAGDVMKAGRAIARSQATEVRVVGLVQDERDRLALGTRLAAHSEAGVAQVKTLGPQALTDVAEADLAIVAVRDPEASRIGLQVQAIAARRRHAFIVALGIAPEARDAFAAALGVRAYQVVASPDGELLPYALTEQAVKALGERKYALASSFPAFRAAATASVISATSWQNAAVATFLAVPGADMPVLTANQIKMVLEIAAIHGENIGMERAKEILAVVAGAFVLRTVAREMLGFIPAAGWVVKGGVAYSGTVAIGKAVERYFSMGPEGRSALLSRARPARSRAVQPQPAAQSHLPAEPSRPAKP